MLNYRRLRTVAANMRRCGLSQILVSDDDSIFYLIGRRVKAQERCGVLLIREDEQVHAFMNELFCIPPVPGVIWHTYRDGEDVYGMIAAELHSGKVGFDKNWPSRHTISILEKREDIIPVLGDAFITRTGHGIGLMVHEPPDVSTACDAVAQEGMVFSIEPGIYLPGDTGVRIEDLVLVTADGCEVLTHYPKELQIIL